MYCSWWLIIRVASIICHLSRPPSYRQSSFHISTLVRYLRNAGKVAWVGIRQASVYCMTQLILRVQKPLSFTLQWLCQLLMFRTVRRLFRKDMGSRSDSVECVLVLCVFSFRCVCYLHDAIYIFSCRVCRYDLCVQYLWRLFSSCHSWISAAFSEP